MIAHGIDLVDISATARLLLEPTGQFLRRCFTEQERQSVGEGVDRVARLAGRFAAKEAVMKALGVGFSEGIGFADIEVITIKSGAPTITLHGKAQRRAQALGIVKWLVSTTHEGNFAMASVIGLGS